jgi:pyruvate/2-oxoglutarate dehydrogenase complex dihydrolipoamide dehydrogenase (E3) component
MEQARVVACHAFGIPFKQMVDAITPIGVLIPRSPVGCTEQQAQADGIDYEVGTARLTHNSSP